jgi:hypothetical protein
MFNPKFSRKCLIQLHVSVVFIIFCQLRKYLNYFQQVNPVETRIREKLGQELKPVHLDVMNESNMHNVPKGIYGLSSINVPVQYNLVHK